MREAFQDQLGQLADHLAEMCAAVGSAMEKATTALLERDLQLAEDRSYTALALQAPVATDLRVVLSAATGRMGWPPLWT
jgi:phosphate transport system protein